MQRTIILASLVFSLFWLVGCVAEGGVRYRAAYVAPAPPMVHVSAGYNEGYADPAPGLIEVSPGVQVISDYDYPVFYSNNMYWRYDGGSWFSSPRYNGGWVTSRAVPGSVRGIGRPESYAHYRRGNVGSSRPVQAPAVRREQPVHRAPAARSGGRRR